MRIHIGSDHAGLEFKAKIIAHLQGQGHQVTDHGPHSFDPLDDYPEFCIPAALATAKDPGSFGIVLGGSGNGEQMAANKVKGVRAALVWSVEIAKLARQHNDANVISLGGRMHDEKLCLELVDTFLSTPFSNDERHIRRIGLISKYEEKGQL
ncbi:MAG: ribose-5-phosphate isomerase [Candidatus Nanopelagicales bacterium]|jgi:ribose 5-phosphate isomerase B|uniref:Ribose-5-phosphate isomerase B n=1 Tax=Actinobacteria bacterium BACL2 MAG-121220-bin52 TaxID=1655573 RepID=A0A0R2P3Q9_9ACTN|nr:MAG: ribose 5-phosphate isomerase [Actinobacteria bacterium BACL2 MAG-121220-bin52]MDP4750803.1 ribose-5-phosphate isomerase [Candidatus Nanopelagicales bacterium]MDP4931536.1 ribose-5-phosphate isomerase [Candidatus Nanopelagicaceae bacterium]